MTRALDARGTAMAGSVPALRGNHAVGRALPADWSALMAALPALLTTCHRAACAFDG